MATIFKYIRNIISSLIAGPVSGKLEDAFLLGNISLMQQKDKNNNYRDLFFKPEVFNSFLGPESIFIVETIHIQELNFVSRVANGISLIFVINKNYRSTSVESSFEALKSSLRKSLKTLQFPFKEKNGSEHESARMILDYIVQMLQFRIENIRINIEHPHKNGVIITRFVIRKMWTKDPKRLSNPSIKNDGFIIQKHLFISNINCYMFELPKFAFPKDSPEAHTYPGGSKLSACFFKITPKNDSIYAIKLYFRLIFGCEKRFLDLLRIDFGNMVFGITPHIINMLNKVLGDINRYSVDNMLNLSKSSLSTNQNRSSAEANCDEISWYTSGSDTSEGSANTRRLFAPSLIEPAVDNSARQSILLNFKINFSRILCKISLENTVLQELPFCKELGGENLYLHCDGSLSKERPESHYSNVFTDSTIDKPQISHISTVLLELSIFFSNTADLTILNVQSICFHIVEYYLIHRQVHEYANNNLYGKNTSSLNGEIEVINRIKLGFQKCESKAAFFRNSKNEFPLNMCQEELYDRTLKNLEGEGVSIDDDEEYCIARDHLESKCWSSCERDDDVVVEGGESVTSDKFLVRPFLVVKSSDFNVPLKFLFKISPSDSCSLQSSEFCTSNLVMDEVYLYITPAFLCDWMHLPNAEISRPSLQFLPRFFHLLPRNLFELPKFNVENSCAGIFTVTMKRLVVRSLFHETSSSLIFDLPLYIPESIVTVFNELAINRANDAKILLEFMDSYTYLDPDWNQSLDGIYEFECVNPYSPGNLAFYASNTPNLDPLFKIDNQSTIRRVLIQSEICINSDNQLHHEYIPTTRCLSRKDWECISQNTYFFVFLRLDFVHFKLSGEKYHLFLKLLDVIKDHVDTHIKDVGSENFEQATANGGCGICTTREGNSSPSGGGLSKLNGEFQDGIKINFIFPQKKLTRLSTFMLEVSINNFLVDVFVSPQSSYQYQLFPGNSAFIYYVNNLDGSQTSLISFRLEEGRLEEHRCNSIEKIVLFKSLQIGTEESIINYLMIINSSESPAVFRITKNLVEISNVELEFNKSSNLVERCFSLFSSERDSNSELCHEISIILNQFLIRHKKKSTDFSLASYFRNCQILLRPGSYPKCRIVLDVYLGYLAAYFAFKSREVEVGKIKDIYEYWKIKNYKAFAIVPELRVHCELNESECKKVTVMGSNVKLVFSEDLLVALANYIQEHAGYDDTTKEKGAEMQTSALTDFDSTGFLIVKKNSNTDEKHYEEDIEGSSADNIGVGCTSQLLDNDLNSLIIPNYEPDRKSYLHVKTRIEVKSLNILIRLVEKPDLENNYFVEKMLFRLDKMDFPGFYLSFIGISSLYKEYMNGNNLKIKVMNWSLTSKLNGIKNYIIYEKSDVKTMIWLEIDSLSTGKSQLELFMGSFFVNFPVCVCSYLYNNHFSILPSFRIQPFHGIDDTVFTRVWICLSPIVLNISVLGSSTLDLGTYSTEDDDIHGWSQLIHLLKDYYGVFIIPIFMNFFARCPVLEGTYNIFTAPIGFVTYTVGEYKTVNNLLTATSGGIREVGNRMIRGISALSYAGLKLVAKPLEYVEYLLVGKNSAARVKRSKSKTFYDALVNAFNEIQTEMKDTKDLVIVPMREYKNKNEFSKLAVEISRAAPLLVIKPVMGLVRGVTKTLEPLSK